jgi:hypothetical protein
MDFLDYIQFIAEDLELLNETQAVNLLADLLYNEAYAIDLAPGDVDVPRTGRAVRTPDGGVDATVAAAPSASPLHLIEPGFNAYQVKSGDMRVSASSAKGIVCDSRSSLLPRVQDCINRGGTYTVFLTGKDIVEPGVGQTLKELIEHEITSRVPEGTTIKVKVLKASQIKDILNTYPSVALGLKEDRGVRSFKSHNAWKRQLDMRHPYVSTDEQRSRIVTLQEQILGKVANNIRILGEAGCGKTRLALEGLDQEQIRSKVLYFSNPSEFFQNPVFNGEVNFSVIIVVDECDERHRSDIWNRIGHAAERLKLITIYNEYGANSASEGYLAEPPELDDDAIMEIMSQYGDWPRADLMRWAEYCSGSPRVAHVLGDNLRNHQDDLTREPSESRVWDRYIAGSDDPGSDQTRKRHEVLQWVSLFRRFGFKEEHAQEARDIHAMLTADTGIMWAEFKTIIQLLMKRKILQGETTLYITPKLLHVKLWAEWWDNNPPRPDFDLTSFFTVSPTDAASHQISDELKGWYGEMFKYASESPVAGEVAATLLSPGGALASDQFLRTRLGADFFLALTEGTPEESLRFLEAKLDTWTKDDILALRYSRQHLVWGFERILMWGALYPRAVKALAKLARYETASNSNNSSALLADAFTAAFGDLSPTEAGYEVRLTALKDLIDQGPEYSKLAINGIKRALRWKDSLRISGAEFQGLKRKPVAFTPTWQELFDYVQAIWKLLISTEVFWDDANKVEARNAVLDAIRVLADYPFFADILKDFERLVQEGRIEKRDALQITLDVVRYHKELDTTLKQELKRFEKEFTGSTFSEELTRYVGYGLPEDTYRRDASELESFEAIIERLARYGIDHIKELSTNFNWLNTDKAKNGYQFGFKLGELDLAKTFLPEITTSLERLPEATSFFLSGYLGALKTRDLNQWEEVVAGIASDDKLQKLYPEIIWRNRPTVKTAKLLTELIEAGKVSRNTLGLFRLGGVLSELPEEVVVKWITLLVSPGVGLPEVSTALDFVHGYYLRSASEVQQLPEQLTLAILLHQSLTEQPTNSVDQMLDFNWAEVSKAFIAQYESHAGEVVKFVIEHLGLDDTIFNGFNEYTLEVLNVAAKAEPRLAWDILAHQIETKPANLYRILSWLEGGRMEVGPGRSAALELFSKEQVFEWIAKDSDYRSRLIASAVPHDYFIDEDRICWARELLIGYGDDEKVRRALTSTFLSEGWSGPSSLHYQKKLDKFRAYLVAETNEKAKRWLEEEVRVIEGQLKRAKTDEERRGF